MATKAEILEAIDHLARGFPNYSPGNETFDAYIEDLQDLRGDAVRMAARELRRTCEFFPTIAMWRKTALPIHEQIQREEYEAEMARVPRLQVPELRPNPEMMARVRGLVAQLSAQIARADHLAAVQRAKRSSDALPRIGEMP